LSSSSIILFDSVILHENKTYMSLIVTGMIEDFEV